MNTQYPFTQAGFQALSSNLYQLPQPELQEEANTLRKDFKSWIISWFELRPAQINFLNNLQDQTISYIAFQTSFAVENRLQIYLDKEGEDEEIFKIIRSEGNLAITEDSSGVTASGHLIIKISYKR